MTKKHWWSLKYRSYKISFIYCKQISKNLLPFIYFYEVYSISELCHLCEKFFIYLFKKKKIVKKNKSPKRISLFCFSHYIFIHTAHERLSHKTKTQSHNMDTNEDVLASPMELLAMQWYIPVCSLSNRANCIQDVRISGSEPSVVCTVALCSSAVNKTTYYWIL